jgi:hypothetical protein
MSLRDELKELCKHQEGFLYLKDSSENYYTPSQLLEVLPSETLNLEFGFKAGGNEPKVYWVYKKKFLFLQKEEYIFETYIPEGRTGWATDFWESPDFKIHYYDGTKDEYGGLKSVCNRDQRADDEMTLFIPSPDPHRICKFCEKKLNG